MSRKPKKVVQELISFKFVKETLAIYLFLMFVIYPLFYEDKYYNMGDAKWHFFRTVTYYIEAPGFYIPTFLTFLLIFFIWYQIDLLRKGGLKEFWDLKKVTITDKFVFAYLIFCLISTILSPYKDFILWGYDGWYMGLIAQVAFVLLYFFVSRFWRWDDIMLMIYMGASALVFLFGVLNRFRVDPLEMYVGLDEYYIPQFLSTLGQSTWYSSFVAIMLPIGVFIYWYAEKKWVRTLAFLYNVLGAMTLITQDSDSAFFALLAEFSVLFAVSFRENRYMKRFLEIVLITLLSWRVIGFLQIAFPEQAVQLGSLMIFGTQHPILWIPIIIIAGLYAVLSRADKKGTFDVTKITWVRTAYFVLLIAGIAGAVIYITLNSTGVLPESLRSTNNYLLFDEFWGNSRGHSWTVTVESFFDCLKDDPVRAIFGAGPDGFYNTAYKYHSAELFEKWGENTILTCAHNEWLTQIINIGLLGGLAYLGIFVSAIVVFMKNSVKCPELIGVVMAIASYMAHNFFCYQQIICTPMIFIVMGAGASILSTNGLRPIYEEN
ncbi:O-Antigen ligase [Lachnospiraceae bacterium]|nr:O-Antigen ligase [Lachnospiraceae bacterium]